MTLDIALSTRRVHGLCAHGLEARTLSRRRAHSDITGYTSAEAVG